MPIIEDNREELRAALRQTFRATWDDLANNIVPKAKRYVPSDTGELRDSIRATDWKERKSEVSRVVGAFAEHALPVEYGSAGRGEPMVTGYSVSGGTIPWGVIPYGKVRWGPYPLTEDGWQGPIHPGINPQPFMRPAIDEVLTRDTERFLMENAKVELDKVLPRFTRQVKLNALDFYG